MDLGLDTTRVLVTGGAGGIGTAICRRLAAEGATVAVHHHTSGDAAAALAGQIGGLTVRADLTDEEQVEQLVAEAAGAFGALDAVVSNAGIWPADGAPVWELPVARWRETIEVDLTGTFLTVRAFLRHVALREEHARPPAVVLVGSTAGTFGEAGHADYAAAKAGVQAGLLLSLKNEIVRLHPEGRVNAVAPGWTVSPMTAASLASDTIDGITATMPLRKVATPDDVAAAVALLLSDEAAGHVTGQVVSVAGGMEGRLLWPPAP